MANPLLRKLAAVMLPVLLLLAAPAWAGPTLDGVISRGILRVGMDPTFPPLEAKAKDGTIIGFDVDLAGEIASAMGVRLKLVQVAFGELPDALAQGRIDMILSGMTITPRRNLTMVFVGPYLLAGQTILVKSALARKVHGYADLNSPEYTVAAARHTTAVQAIRRLLPRARLQEASGEQNALKLLLSGKAQALVADMPFNSVMAFRHRAQGVVHLDTPFTFEPLGIAIPPGDPELVNWLDNLLTLLRGSGRLDRLGDKWFRDPTWMKRLP